MSILSNPAQLVKGSQSIFMRAVGAAQANLISRIATMVSSDSESETYAWMGDSQQMQLLEDMLEGKSLSDASYSITNAEYASLLTVKRKDRMNDKAGGIAMRINDLATVAMAHPNKLLIAALVAGTTATCYDTAALFSNTHPNRGSSGIQDNLLAGSGTSTANIATDINTMIGHFGTILAENGEPINGDVGASKIAIVYPWALRKAIKENVEAGVISSTDNKQVDGISFDLIPSARLTAEDANDWYALNMSPATGSLIFQQREALRFESQTDGDKAFLGGDHMFKAQAYYAVGYGRWQHAVKFVNT